MRVGAAAVVLLLSACAATGTPPTSTLLPEPPDSSTTTTVVPATTSTTVAATTSTTVSPLSEGWWAVRPAGELAAYLWPGAVEPFRWLPAQTILGSPATFLVVGHHGDAWLEVMLPGRPNGHTAWVRRDQVELRAIEQEIRVDLSERELVLLYDGEVVVSTPVAVGSAGSPTPTGLFYVTDSVRLTNPNSPWGPFALGLSARSDTVTEFNGGDGIIGIHGTNNPGSIGHAASLGCVRVPNEVITEIASLVPLGTPVLISS